jgi:glutamine amidotransferase PdxT
VSDYAVVSGLTSVRDALDRLTAAFEERTLAGLGSSNAREGKMSEEIQSESKSSVAVDGTAKGDAVTKAKAYEGVTEEEMLRLADIAVETYVYARQKLFEKGVPLP